MKHLLLAATAAIAIALSASTAIAQQADGSLAYDAAILQAFSDASQGAPPAISQFVVGQSGGQLLASDLIDRGVNNSSMSMIGVVVDVDKTALEKADEFKPLAEAAALNDFQGTFDESTNPTPEKDATSANQ